MHAEPGPMLSHHRVWSVIDALAHRHGLTASALARRSGLDPTAFNPSKRVGPDGRLRWPSTESLSKVLEATSTSLAEFALLLARWEGEGGPLPPPSPADAADRPAPGFADSQKGGFAGWNAGEPLLEVPVGSRRFEPLYRPGDRLIVGPKAAVRAGDRVLLAEALGSPYVAEVISWADPVVVAPPGGEPVAVPRTALVFAARILWVSQ
jgi:hypothetical protein